MNDPNRKDTLGTHVAEYARRFNIPLVSREQVVASAAKIRPPEVLGEGEFNRIDAAAPDAGQAMAYAPEEPPPVQMASLGGAAPPPVDRGAIAQTIAGPPPQPAAQPPVQLAQAPQQQMPIGTRVPTGGAAQPSGPPRPPDPEPMSAREVQLRQAAGSSADPRIAGQLMPVIQQMEEARKAAYAVKLKQWEADLATYKSAQDPVHRANLERMQVEAAEKAKERAKVDARGGVPQSVIDEKLKESAKVAGPLREASGAINQIEDLLDQGIFTGTLGKFDLAAAKLKQAVGGAVDPRVARTEQFTSSIKPITAAARAALAGGANISDRDLQAAEAAAGGDITLTKEGIQRIMSSLRTIQLQTAMHHQGILETAAGGDTAAERTLYGLHGLPMENIISKNHPAVQRLMENADNEHERGLFDKAFHTPGLAERIIVKNKGR
jgi:hypothetical protein